MAEIEPQPPTLPLLVRRSVADDFRDEDFSAVCLPVAHYEAING